MGGGYTNREKFLQKLVEEDRDISWAKEPTKTTTTSGGKRINIDDLPDEPPTDVQVKEPAVPDKKRFSIDDLSDAGAIEKEEPEDGGSSSPSPKIEEKPTKAPKAPDVPGPERPAWARWLDQKLPGVKKVGDELTPVGAGAAKGASLSFADELAGALAFGEHLNDSYNPVKKLLGSKPKDGSALDAYRRARDAYRAEEEAQKKSAPGKFLVGEIGGGIALPVPGGAVSKGGVVARAAKAALQGAGVGAVGGLGSSEADLTKGEFGDAAKDVASGAKAAATFNAGSSLALSGVSKVASKLLGGAEGRAVKAAGGIQKDLKKLATRGDDEVERVGRELLEETAPDGSPIISANPFKNSKKEIGQRLQSRLKDLGDRIGSILDSNANPEVSKHSLVAAIEQEAAKHSRSPAGRSYVKALKEEAKAIERLMDDVITARDLHDEKKAVQALVNYDKLNPTSEGAARAREFVASQLKEAEEAAVWLAHGDDQLNTFKLLKQKFGRLSRPKQWAEEAIPREKGNNFLPLGAQVLGAGALAGGGGAAGAMGLALGQKLMKEHGDAALARALYKDALARHLEGGAKKMTPVVRSKWEEYFGE